MKIEEMYDYIEHSDGLEIKVIPNKNDDGVDIDFIGTGTKIWVVSKETDEIIKIYTCIVFGDVNGDGYVKASDYVLIKNYIMEEGELSGKRLEAADVNNDGKIKSTDYVLIKNYIMNGEELRKE